MTTTPVRVITTLNNSQPPHSPSLVTEYKRGVYTRLPVFVTGWTMHTWWFI